MKGLGFFHCLSLVHWVCMVLLTSWQNVRPRRDPAWIFAAAPEDEQLPCLAVSGHVLLSS